MTIKEAFADLINKKNYSRMCKGVSPSTVRGAKQAFKNGTIERNTMEKLLKAAGYKQKEDWQKP